MDFFTKQDFEFYSNAIRDKITSKSSNWVNVRNQLTKEGVFAKTGHWARYFKNKDYKVVFRNDCQYSGKLRHYSWAKIYLRGYENTDVFFTIGVGSIFQENTRVFELVYKFDCQRKRGDITPYQIKLFDKYVMDNIPKRGHIKLIKQDELVKKNWETLFTETQKFIYDFEDHYQNVVELIWPNGVSIIPKVARLCWNDLGWEKPSGLDGKSQNTDHTFESKGYGHEEWLFDLDRVIDGCHYGFIQAFNKGDHYGKNYDLHLYTLKRVGNKSECYWIGRIKYAQVLTKEEQKEVYNIYKNKGWYPEMMKELNDVGVVNRDLEIVSEEELFNVKFKIDGDIFTKFEESIFIENPKEEISKGYGRYGLKDLLKSTLSIEKASGQYKFKPGHNPTKTGTTKSVYSKKTVNRTLKHKEIQEYMYNQLVQEYGEQNVGTEVATGRGTSIDVVVVQPSKSERFYEVKTYNQPLVCVREAFGQILEYAMFSESNHAEKLIVVGVNKPNKSENDYLEHLRRTTGLNIYYQVFDLNHKILLNELF